jgi:hypothetical protein
LLDGSRWEAFPDEFFTPVEEIVEVVLMLVKEDDMADGKGVRISADRAWGRAVEGGWTQSLFQGNARVLQ